MLSWTVTGGLIAGKSHLLKTQPPLGCLEGGCTVTRAASYLAVPQVVLCLGPQQEDVVGVQGGG